MFLVHSYSSLEGSILTCLGKSASWGQEAFPQGYVTA